MPDGIKENPIRRFVKKLPLLGVNFNGVAGVVQGIVNIGLLVLSKFVF